MHLPLGKFLVCLLLAFMSATVFAFTFDESNRSDPRISLAPYVDYYQTPDNPLPYEIEAADWVPNTSGEMLSLGYTYDNVYLRITLSNDSNHFVRRVLSIDFPLLDYIEFFDSSSVTAKSGDGIPFSARPLKSIYHGFELNLFPFQTRTFYFKVTTQGGFQLPLYLYTHEQFNANEQRFSSIASFSVGLTLAVAFFGLVLGFVYKRSAFFYLSGFSVSILLFCGAYYGFIYRYLIPNHPYIHHFVVILTVSIFIFATGMLISSLYGKQHKSQRYPLVFSFLRLHFYIPCLLPILYLVFDYQVATISTFAATSVLFIGSLASSLRITLPDRLAPFYIFAWSLLAIGGVVLALADMGILKGPFYFHSLSVVFFVTIIIFISLVIATLHTEQMQRIYLAEKAANIRSQEVSMSHNIMMGQLVGGLNHEINTPISTIDIALHSLKDEMQNEGVLTPPIEEVINAATFSLSKISNILIEMKEISKSSRSDAFTRINLRELMASLPQSVRSLNTIDYNIDEISPSISIQGYRDLLVQLFINLANNSIYAMEKSNHVHPLIWVKAYVLDANVLLTWQDNGIGMSTYQQNRIFEPFFTSKPVTEGTGLGMSNALSIVRIHKGDIKVKSNEGVSTTFYITLPLEVDESAA